MKFEAHDVAAPHSDHVEAIFHFSEFTPDHSIERVVPTGHVFLLIELDGMQRTVFDNKSLQPLSVCNDAWISGMQQHYLSISAHQNSSMFVIQFRAAGAYPYLHTPMHELSNRVTPAAELAGAELLALRRELLNSTTSAEKFSAAERWLDARLRIDLIAPDGVASVVAALQAAPANEFAAAVSNFDGSHKHLIDQFHKYVGLTPKRYQRVLRFNEIFGHIQREQRLDWADIAARCGYSDQSHFIREFKHFSGFNPSEFIRERFDEGEANFFPLDRDG